MPRSALSLSQQLLTTAQGAERLTLGGQPSGSSGSQGTWYLAFEQYALCQAVVFPCMDILVFTENSKSIFLFMHGFLIGEC